MKNRDYFKGVATGAALVVCLIVVCLAGLKLFNSIYYGFGQGVLSVNEFSVFTKLNSIESIIDANSYYDVDDDKANAYIYKGLISALGDKYAAYYTPEEYEKVRQSNDGKYRGIGVKFDSKSLDNIVITQVYENSPAEKAGIQVGDIIRTINGEDYAKSLSTEAIYTIRNANQKTISMGLYRPSTDTSFTVDVEIADIEEPSTSSKMLDGQIGYIQIMGFQSETAKQFKERFENLKSEGMKALIIDMRDNPGGYVNPTTDILDYLLPECDILKTERRNGETKVYKSKESAALDIPCIILTNGDTASAAEIFAGAMKDNNAATIVGEKTYGKGIVQGTFPLADGSAVKITVEKYYTPSGFDIHEHGIEPDVTIEKGEEGDAQLDKALELLKAGF